MGLHQGLIQKKGLVKLEDQPVLYEYYDYHPFHSSLSSIMEICRHIVTFLKCNLFGCADQKLYQSYYIKRLSLYIYEQTRPVLDWFHDSSIQPISGFGCPKKHHKTLVNTYTVNNNVCLSNVCSVTWDNIIPSL